MISLIFNEKLITYFSIMVAVLCYVLLLLLLITMLAYFQRRPRGGTSKGNCLLIIFGVPV